MKILFVSTSYDVTESYNVCLVISADISVQVASHSRISSKSLLNVKMRNDMFSGGWKVGGRYRIEFYNSQSWSSLLSS